VGTLLGGAIGFYGWPLDTYTWTVVLILFVLGSTAGTRTTRIVVFPFVLYAAWYLFAPNRSLTVPERDYYSLFDDRGGRRGIQIPPGLRFGRDGQNTALLESYLGPLPPNWWEQAPLWPGIRDGNERVHSRNVISYHYLPSILAMLPSDAARRQVLRCLTDPENRLRVHQGLLLACLACWGYPEGFDAESWWQHHQVWFVQERDPVHAARVTYGWTSLLWIVFRHHDSTNALLDGEVRRQLDVAWYQEHGNWGGHEDFGEALFLLDLGAPPERLERLSKNPASWWPSAPPVLWPERLPEEVQRRRMDLDPRNIERARETERWLRSRPWP
jgi:hypothetical protein